MKRILAFAIILLASVALKAQTADEVINKYITAVGGKDKLQSIKSLQYVQTMNLNTPMGAMEISLTNIKVDNKLFRMNTSSEMFGTSFTVVTDTSGWVLIPANPFTGSTEATLQKLKPEERKSLMPQMACDGYFPELVNYSAKGYSAEFLGEGKASGRLSYKVKIKKDKDERIYMIDKQTGYVNSMTIKGASAAAMSGMGNSGMSGGGNADKFELTMNFSDYLDVSGIKFPGKLKIETPMMGTVESSITGIKVNQPVDAKWYKPQ